jgi:hypothetical protein
MPLQQTESVWVASLSPSTFDLLRPLSLNYSNAASWGLLFPYENCQLSFRAVKNRG